MNPSREENAAQLTSEQREVYDLLLDDVSRDTFIKKKGQYKAIESVWSQYPFKFKVLIEVKRKTNAQELPAVYQVGHTRLSFLRCNRKSLRLKITNMNGKEIDDQLDKYFCFDDLQHKRALKKANQLENYLQDN